MCFFFLFPVLFSLFPSRFTLSFDRMGDGSDSADVARRCFLRAAHCPSCSKREESRDFQRSPAARSVPDGHPILQGKPPNREQCRKVLPALAQILKSAFNAGPEHSIGAKWEAPSRSFHGRSRSASYGHRIIRPVDRRKHKSGATHANGAAVPPVVIGSAYQAASQRRRELEGSKFPCALLGPLSACSVAV